MNTQTKCTLVIVGLFIVEILPVPLTSLYSLFAIRRRPNWLPKTVANLYANKAEVVDYALPVGHDFTQTQKKYTFILVAMFMVDLLIPVVIPAALYIVRVRPQGFKTLITKLYGDKLAFAAVKPETQDRVLKPNEQADLQLKLAQLEFDNKVFAKSLVNKG
jgi:hypothetical protein